MYVNINIKPIQDSSPVKIVLPPLLGIHHVLSVVRSSFFLLPFVGHAAVQHEVVPALDHLRGHLYPLVGSDLTADCFELPSSPAHIEHWSRKTSSKETRDLGGSQKAFVLHLYYKFSNAHQVMNSDTSG